MELSSTETTVMVVDDHPIVRRGLTQLIDQEKDLSVSAGVENAAQALELLETFRPDMMVVDISLNGTSGIELVKNVKALYSDVLILVLSMHDEFLFAERALRAGANGYIMKQEGTEKLIIAIRKILDGNLYISEGMGKRLLSKLVAGRDSSNTSTLQRLSDRELEVFQLIGNGFGTRQIAQQLYLSIKTVESHRAKIKEKLKLKNAMELVQFAIKWTLKQC